MHLKPKLIPLVSMQRSKNQMHCSIYFFTCMRQQRGCGGRVWCSLAVGELWRGAEGMALMRDRLAHLCNNQGRSSRAAACWLQGYQDRGCQYSYGNTFFFKNLRTYTVVVTSCWQTVPSNQQKMKNSFVLPEIIRRRRMSAANHFCGVVGCYGSHLLFCTLRIIHHHMN